MRPSRNCFLSFVTVVFVIPVLSHGQNTDPSIEAGIHPYATYDGVRESINLGTGNVYLSVPLLSLPGRNGHNYSVALISNSQNWYTPQNTSGAENHQIGMTVTRTGAIYFVPSGVSSPAPSISCISGYTLTDEQGAVHPFSGLLSNCVLTGGSNQPRQPQYEHLAAYDDSGQGILADINACRLTYLDGTWYPMAASGCPLYGVIGNSSATTAAIATDSNGNQIVSGAFEPAGCGPVCGGGGLLQNGTDVDTLNRSVSFSGTNHTIQYQDSTGTTRTITLNIQSLSLASCSLHSSGSVNLITSAVLPNGLTYIFHYDQCGDVDKVVYPSGGYTRYNISYSFDVQVTAKYVCRTSSGTPGATSVSGDVPNGQRSISTCTVTEDMTTYSPSVSTQHKNSANTVTDTLGNKTVYQFTNYSSLFTGPVV